MENNPVLQLHADTCSVHRSVVYTYRLVAVAPTTADAIACVEAVKLAEISGSEWTTEHECMKEHRLPSNRIGPDHLGFWYIHGFWYIPKHIVGE